MTHLLSEMEQKSRGGDLTGVLKLFEKIENEFGKTIGPLQAEISANG